MCLCSKKAKSVGMNRGGEAGNRVGEGGLPQCCHCTPVFFWAATSAALHNPGSACAIPPPQVVIGLGVGGAFVLGPFGHSPPKGERGLRSAKYQPKPKFRPSAHTQAHAHDINTWPHAHAHAPFHGSFVHAQADNVWSKL